MTTMTSGAAAAVMAAGTVIPKVIQKLHAAGADSRLGKRATAPPLEAFGLRGVAMVC
jgi:hypothetical protein